MSGTDEHEHEISESEEEEEETNGDGMDEISEVPPEEEEMGVALRPLASDFLDMVPIQGAGAERDGGGSDEEMETAKGVKMENGSNGLDEEDEEEDGDRDGDGESSEEEEREVKLEREVKMEEETIVPFEDQNPVSGSGSELFLDGDDSGDEDEQAAFMQELERFHVEHNLEYKPPKFYGKALNCLKLWRQVIKLGGYETVTSCKLWRQVGESFRPPKTCTTVSWSFRIFYEKSLLEYEKYKVRTGELQIPESTIPETNQDNRLIISQMSGSNRIRRDAAQRAMDGWHSQRLLGNGEVGDPIIKDKNQLSIGKKDKQVKIVGLGNHSKSDKKRKTSSLDRAFRVAPRTRIVKSESGSMIIDAGAPADWVKVNVRQTKDCYEVYALVPGLLREEVHVQSDPAGRLVISGEPEQPDNPWGVTPFKKVVSLPSRIDPHQTSAVVTLHGQLFVRVPFENSEM